jgi:hypothetical protein
LIFATGVYLERCREGRKFPAAGEEKLARHRLRANGASRAAAAAVLDAGVDDLAAADAEPAFDFPVARIAPLFLVPLIVLLLRPGVSAPTQAR